MTLATLSSKYQITLPRAMLIDFQVLPGDQLVVDRDDDVLTLKPMKQSMTDQVAGSLSKYVKGNKRGLDFNVILAKTKNIVSKELI